MRRRDFVLLGAAAFIVSDPARAQKKTAVIGLMWNDSVKPSPYVSVFVTAMSERGYVLDRDFRIEDHVTLEGYGGYADSAEKLVRARVDVIVTSGATAAVAAAKATKDIPIVMIIGSDPVATGLVPSFARPGGNLTGVATLTAGLNAKRIQLLKELDPRLSTLGILLAANVANPRNIREVEAAAQALKLDAHIAQVNKPDDFAAAIEDLAKKRVGAFYVGPSTMLAAHSVRLVELIARQRIPAVFSHERFVDAGGLMSYASSARKAFVRATGYVDRILKGAQAGELAIEQTGDLVEVIVNLKTAKALGIKVPTSILVRADRVIE